MVGHLPDTLPLPVQETDNPLTIMIHAQVNNVDVSHCLCSSAHILTLSN